MIMRSLVPIVASRHEFEATNHLLALDTTKLDMNRLDMTQLGMDRYSLHCTKTNELRAKPYLITLEPILSSRAVSNCNLNN